MNEGTEGWWPESGHGVYLTRGDYDEGPHGDNWSYIDKRTLCIVDYRPEMEDGPLRDKPIVIAGPFPTMHAAKAAFVLLYGRDTND